MDVRCEKCQTEYELDESRLKPGGVTVKCTNCGHMFKIRKRANTNVGIAGGAAAAAAPPDTRAKPVSSKQPLTNAAPRADSVPSEGITDMPSGPNSERQWQVRLENGDTKTCRELATLQQWIVAGVVSRESLISRSGKTWKRLGDITELNQYFIIADEARVQRSAKPTGKTGNPAATMMGVGMGPKGNDDDEARATGNYRARQPTPPPPPPAPTTASHPKANPLSQTELAPASGSMPARRPPTQPPPAPRVKPPSDVGRQTAAWVGGEIKHTDSMAEMPQGPQGGRLSAAAADEPAFGGRVRQMEDEDEIYPASKGSRVGMWIALVSLAVIGAAAGAVYMLVLKGKSSDKVVETVKKDAGVPPPMADAAQLTVTPVPDAQEVVSPVDQAKAELYAGVWARMKTALEGLSGKDDPASLAMRARLATAMAQGMNDRAGFVDKAEGDKLRKEAKQMVIDAAPLAQRALSGQADSAAANLAMADIMRLQAKPAPAVKRYIDTARSKMGTDKELMASVALADAQLAMRDGKLPDAQKALAGVEAPDDMRVKLALAQVLFAQNKAADAKAQVDQVIATQPDNDVALAMYKKLETVVAKTDPMPQEDGGKTPPPPNGGSAKPPTGGGGGGGGGGDSYDALLAKANKTAEQNCTKAMDLYMKALEQRPNGVEALTGMGYCHLDAKQFSSAFSKFRAALAVSSKYEPALGGVAETYQRQGNKEAAIEAWKKYLDAYPTSAKAKKQLEILGAGGDDSQPKEQPKETPKEPPKDTPPPPAPAPGSAG